MNKARYNWLAGMRRCLSSLLYKTTGSMGGVFFFCCRHTRTDDGYHIERHGRQFSSHAHFHALIHEGDGTCQRGFLDLEYLSNCVDKVTR